MPVFNFQANNVHKNLIHIPRHKTRQNLYRPIRLFFNPEPPKGGLRRQQCLNPFRGQGVKATYEEQYLCEG
jgi:hypothetical protein